MKKLLEQYKKREERKNSKKSSKSKNTESFCTLYDALALYKHQKDDSELSEETQLKHNREQLIKDLEKVRETEKHKEKLKNYFRETLPSIEAEEEPMGIDSEYLREIMNKSMNEKENKKLDKEKENLIAMLTPYH